MQRGCVWVDAEKCQRDSLKCMSLWQVACAKFTSAIPIEIANRSPFSVAQIACYRLRLHQQQLNSNTNVSHIRRLCASAHVSRCEYENVCLTFALICFVFATLKRVKYSCRLDSTRLRFDLSCACVCVQHWYSAHAHFVCHLICERWLMLIWCFRSKTHVNCNLHLSHDLFTCTFVVRSVLSVSIIRVTNFNGDPFLRFVWTVHTNSLNVNGEKNERTNCIILSDRIRSQDSINVLWCLDRIFVQFFNEQPESSALKGDWLDGHRYKNSTGTPYTTG